MSWYQCDHVVDMFRQRRAHSRFRDLLERRGKLTAWYEHEERAAEAALRQWCADNDLPLAD